MCIYNRSSFNPQKFVSLLHRERLILGIPCGHCVECESRLKNEYYFRSLYEYRSCVQSGGYALFDCLTYDENNVPRITDFLPELPKNMNYRCFSRDDIRLFFVRLRTYLTKRGYSVGNNLKYFVSSEYGTRKGCTHRPHFHLLLYVYNNFIDPISLSRAISSCWSLGRTDGIKYKGSVYFFDNCVIKSSLSSSIRVSKYVSKYVQKSCSYRKEIESRISRIVWLIYQTKYLDLRIDWRIYRNMMNPEIRDLESDVKIEYDRFYNWQRSPDGRKVRQSIRRLIDQFHRQSQGFGISALDDIDYNLLVSSGQMKVVDDSSNFIMFIPLPTYYKRKLFYNKVSLLGVQSWELNDKGIKFMQDREPYILKHIALSLENKCLSSGDATNYDFEKLAEYSYFKRGRLNGVLTDLPSISVKSHYIGSSYLLYNYSTPSDFQFYKLRFLSPSYLGNIKSGLLPIEKDSVIDYNEFVRRLVIDSPLDSILNKIDGYTKVNKQNVYENVESLSDKHRFLGLLN